MCKRTQQLMLSYCVRLHVAKSFDRGFKLCATTTNNTQQHVTGCENGRNM